MGLFHRRQRFIPHQHALIHLIPQSLNMDVDGRMDLIFVERVKLCSADSVCNAGAKLPQTVEIHLPEADCRVLELQCGVLLAYKRTEIVIAVNSAHDDIVHRTDAGRKRFG